MKILFSGEGGQGVQVIAEILARAAFVEGKHASYIPNFGVEQRGGVSLAFVVIDKNPVVYPKFGKTDILAILSDRSIERVKRYSDKKTKIILGPAVTKREIPNTTPKVWNILVLGKINQLAKLVKTASLVKAMDERFSLQFKKNPQLRKIDVEALKNARF